MSNVIDARVISITGEEIARLDGATNRGKILEHSFTWEKIGGLRNFTLRINKENMIPFFNGMRWEFYFKDATFLDIKKIFTGYTEIIPTSESDEPTILIEGKGYYNKLKEKFLTQDYNNQSINTIINSLNFSGLDLDTNFFNIAGPSVNVTVSFKNKTFTQVLDTLLQIANSSYLTTQYIWGVDENRGLYFKALESVYPDVRQKLFEGYNFQNPQVELSNTVVNRLTVFRPTLADSKITELVAVYNNSDSQQKYGIIEDKLTLGDYVDTATAARIASAILEEKQDPEKLIKVDEVYTKDIVEAEVELK